MMADSSSETPSLIARLRKALGDGKESKSGAVDVSQVLALSQQLAEQDPDFVRFSVDAGLIDRLGRELVSRPETAVAELIKNAYDADATRVTLSFSNTQEPGGCLVISDNGSGMTREQFISGFMRLSSGDKIREPVSPRLKRQRAGRKGIGRFAVQRLGTQLEIVSQTKDSPSALHVFVDWDSFASGSDLNSVASRIREIKKEREEGTTLTIHGLREGWTETALKRIYRAVADLIQPFTLRDKRVEQNASATLVSKDTSAFEVLLRHEEAEAVTVVDDTSELLDHALAVIEGFVDEEGRGYWSVTSEKTGVEEKILPLGADRENHNLPFPTLRNVDFKAYYFIYGKAGMIPRSVNKSIEETAARRGGIKLYRNGYRVQPYGEPGDDWLSLDYAAQVRRVLVPISNKNFFGFVEIFDPEGAQFEETASREGLLDNEAFRELTQFVYRVLIAAVSRIGQARKRKVTATQPDWNPKDSPAARLRAAAAEIRAVGTQEANSKGLDNTAKPPFDDSSELQGDDDSLGDGTGSSQTEVNISILDIERLADNVEKVAEEQEEREEALLHELGMLRVLSSLGLIISEFTHEVKATLGSARLDARHLSEVLTTLEEQKRAARLLENIERFKAYASYFDRAVIEKNRRELVPQDLHKQINAWHEIVKLSAERAGIEIHNPVFDSYELLTCPMHASELASVLFNFYTNSDKAIRRADRGTGEIHLTAGREGRRVYIEFSDNGDGIVSENEERIFDAFYTTATPATARAYDEDALQGTGLGLKIVRDIAQSYGGDVMLVQPPDGYVTCFRLELPEASEEQKAEYGY